MKKGKTSGSFHEILIEDLKDPEFSAEYLNNAIEENDPKYFLKALRNVAEAMGGMTKVAQRSHLSRMTLYRIFSKKGNPEFYSLLDILKALKLKFVFKAA
ncbi:MAG: putative addiction module antidote protein [Deltaproteobacteria bacterium]|nr:putative addiction module antidote protein [Deltaproteobacteria bacterium]